MNSENAPKEIVKSFMDLANMAKELMDENQQPSVNKSQKYCFPVQEVEGRREMKAESFIGLVQLNRLLLPQLIKILVLQHHLPQNGQFQNYGDQKVVGILNKFATFFHVKSSDFRFVTQFMQILKFGLRPLSFKVFQTKTKTELF